MPTFLDLPVEIRSQIYFHILNSDAASPGTLPIEPYVVNVVNETPQKGWYQRVARPETHWLDLLLVSKSINAELTTLLNSNAVRNNKQLTTYYAYLTPQSLEWLKVSVPGSSVRHLHFTVVCTGIHEPESELSQGRP